MRSPDDVADQWVANRYPHPVDFVAAHRAFLDRLFAEPTARAGLPRWGIKTVRLGGEHAAYLKALYPDARVVFLVRNPYDAFLSYRLLHDVRTSSYWWYYRWPDKAVSTASQFGLVWHDLTRSFYEMAPQLGALIVSFEALATGETLDVLETFVGASLDRSILDRARGFVEGAAPGAHPRAVLADDGGTVGPPRRRRPASSRARLPASDFQPVLIGWTP